MKHLAPRRSTALLILILIVVLVVLGRLQYQSIQQVSDARARDMEENLQTALFDFRHALEAQLTGLCLELQANGERFSPPTAKEFGRRLSQWSQTTAHPALVNEIYIWDSNSGANPIQISADGLYNPSSWPQDLENIAAELKEFPYPGAPPETNAVPGNPRPNNPRPPRLARGGHGRMARFRWMMDQDHLVLVHPTLIAENSGQLHMAWLVVPLNRDFLVQHLLPELVEHQFAGRGESYLVAVTIDGPHPSVLYSSQPGFGSSPKSAMDARLNIFGPPSLIRGTSLSHLSGVIVPAFIDSRSEGPTIFIDPLVPMKDEAGLEVLAKHQKGSLEAAVAYLRGRSLAVNFGVLGILAITLVIVIVTSQRAHTLAQMQMDFVAGVSHELKTPLTAILLAARNLEDGVVRENALARYGSAIQAQAAQLSGLVDEILLFSETHSGRHVYKIEPLDVTLGIQTTLETMAPLIESSAFNVEEDIGPHLPLVNADAAAFSLCLQNLIGNSLKYGGEKRWIGVKAYFNPNGGKKEICVSVQDQGLGIGSKDLKQIFEPFYRSPEVASEIRGNGLGLPLTRTMVEAMGGHLTVASEPGKGSTFTIHLRPAGA